MTLLEEQMTWLDEHTKSQNEISKTLNEFFIQNESNPSMLADFLKDASLDDKSSPVKFYDALLIYIYERKSSLGV